MVTTCRVAKRFGEEWAHRLEHFRIGRSGGVMIHLDRQGKHGIERLEHETTMGELVDGTRRHGDGLCLTR